jgi:hypothetical protein
MITGLPVAGGAGVFDEEELPPQPEIPIAIAMKRPAQTPNTPPSVMRVYCIVRCTCDFANFITIS